MTLRIALAGAFPYPLPQGSQRFLTDQARALTSAGADVTVFTYGSGQGPAPADVALRRTPRRTSPARLASGLSPRKPLADVALSRTLLRSHRERPFRAVLAHNAEAALAAFAARARGGPPVIYVAHTLWREELACHLPADATSPLWARVGAALDRRCARRASGVLVLTRAARTELTPHASGPVALVPPGWAPEPAPPDAAIREACERVGVAPGGYVVYAGNLDRYQNLGVLAGAARRLPELPVVAVTHARDAGGLRGLRVAPGATVEQTRALVHGASCVAIPRRLAGGFPLKLLDAMAAARAVVGHGAVLGRLRHGESAWSLPRSAGAAQWAATLAGLQSEPALRDRLGRGARAVLETDHAWPKLADRTLQLVASLR